MSFFALLASFAPWIVFKITAHLPFANPLVGIKVAMALSTAVCLWQASRDKTRGIIFWGTIAFFAFGFTTVVILTNMWVIFHLGWLSQLQLTALTWGSIVFGRPFTADYAKQHVPQTLWGTPGFMRKNYLITGVWALAFTVGLITEIMHLKHMHISGMGMEFVDDAAMLAAMVFTTLYTRRPEPEKSKAA